MDQNYTDKVAKLLAKAENDATPDAEREALFDMVAKITAKYMISDADIEAHRAAGTVPEAIVRRHLSCLEGTSMRLTYAMVHIAMSIADAMNCHGYSRKSDRYNKPYLFGLVLVGHTSDVDRVVYLWESLQRQVLTPMGVALKKEKNSYGGYYPMSRQQKDVFRSSFITNFGARVAHRLTMMRREAVVEASAGTDLVLVERIKKVDGWISEHMRIGTARRRATDSAGASAGWSAGAKASLGQGDLGASANAPALGR